MNIGIMCHSSFGGSARIATELAAELARRGHTVHLFTRTTPFGRWDQASRVRLHRAVVDGESHIHPAMLYTDWPEGECEAFVSQIRGINRPVDLKFGPDACAYLVDYGAVRDFGQSDPDSKFKVAADGPLVQIPGTGVIWKICRSTGGPEREDEEDLPVDVSGWDLRAAARTVTPVPDTDLDDK